MEESTTAKTDDSRHHARQRRAGTFRQAIVSAIHRRIALSEPLTIRAILSEAGGGSTTTVRDELKKISIDEGKRFLDGDVIRSFAEREAALRGRLQDLDGEAETLRRSNEALKAALSKASEPSVVLERQVSDIGRDVRGAVQEVLREVTRIRKSRERSTETVNTVDPLAEARLQRILADHAALVEKHRKLKTLYFEATGETFDD